jgi:hypothetical protein
VDQTRLAHALHHPCALTSRLAKIEHGPLASPGLPEYRAQLLQAWPAAWVGYLAASTLVVSDQHEDRHHSSAASANPTTTKAPTDLNYHGDDLLTARIGQRPDEQHAAPT